MKSSTDKGNGHGCLTAAIALVVMLVSAGAIYSHFGGFGTGPSADADEFARYATSVSDIEIPEGTRIIALGEATHGNREFQELKLDVLQLLVERYDVRSFALEGDFGGCEAVNRYIHGGEGTAEDAAASIGFALYRTEQMADLIEWMRTYNNTAAAGDDLQFFGFDMQRRDQSYLFLLEEARKLGIDTTKLEEAWDDSDSWFVDENHEEALRSAYASIEELVKQLPEDEDTTFMLHLIDCLEQNLAFGRVVSDAAQSNGLRDSFMAQNVLWLLGQEEKRGNRRVFISAHNGHIEQEGTYYGTDMEKMGALLANELSEAYFAIGTDFYKADVNLPKGSDGERMTHTFYSYDPLAKAADTCGFESCWLDFSNVPKDSSLYEYVHEPIMMGSLGESFSPLMYVLPQAYRVKREPVSQYDGMIIVPSAHPTVIDSR